MNEELMQILKRTLEDIENGKSRSDYTNENYKVTTYKCGTITRIDIKEYAKITKYKQMIMEEIVDEAGDDLPF